MATKACRACRSRSSAVSRWGIHAADITAFSSLLLNARFLDPETVRNWSGLISSSRSARERDLHVGLLTGSSLPGAACSCPVHAKAYAEWAWWVWGPILLHIPKH